MLARSRQIAAALLSLIAFLFFLILQKERFNSVTVSDKASHEPEIEKDFVAPGGICKKSNPDFTEDWLRSEIKAFVKVYKNRPTVPNTYGTKLAHQFALWATIRWIKPLHIIESGIYQGLGSWLIRQAAPNAQLILLDPNGARLKYKDDRQDSKYFTASDFKDFSELDWNSMNINKDRTLIFFDDHQSGILRTKQAYDRGFTHIMFDDNYTGPDGDNLSLKMSCLLKHGVHPPGSVRYRYDFNRVNRPMTPDDLKFIDDVFENIVTIYYEFPVPWDFTHSSPYILLKDENQSDIEQKFNITQMDEEFIKVKEGYYNICYVKLQQKS